MNSLAGELAANKVAVSQSLTRSVGRCLRNSKFDVICGGFVEGVSNGSGSQMSSRMLVVTPSPEHQAHAASDRVDQLQRHGHQEHRQRVSQALS